MFSDKIFIVHVYALEISCLCPYKESEISENDTSYFRLPQSLQSGGVNFNLYRRRPFRFYYLKMCVIHLSLKYFFEKVPFLDPH